MVVSVGTISAAQTNAFNADKPIILSKNLLESGIGLDVTGGTGPETISACWRSEQDYSGSLTHPVKVNNPLTVVENSDPWRPPTRAFDRSIGSFTSPFGAAFSGGYTKHCFIARIPANSVSNPIDCVVIGAHNFDEIDFDTGLQPLKVTMHVSDTSTFTSYYTPVEWNITADHSGTKRLTSFDLGGGSYTYYNVQYVQIVVSMSSGGGNFLPAPQIGEIFVGPRRQLSRNPDQASWETDKTENAIGEFSSKTGVKTRYHISSGREVMNPSWHPSGDLSLGTTDLYGLDDLATFDTFWADVSYGSKPFFFFPTPSTQPTNAYFMYSEKTVFPSRMVGGLTERDIEFDFKELSPYLNSET